MRGLALVTGGSRRVGRAIALELARASLDLVLTFREDERGAEATAEEARALGASVRVDRCDLARAEQVEGIACSIAEGEGRLDVLVHNASVYRPSPLGTLVADEATSVFAVNAIAPLHLSARLAPLLSASSLPGGGSIVAMSDIHASHVPRRNHAAYLMSKGALEVMVRALARDLAPRVRVNGVAPGVVAFGETGIDADPEVRRAYLARVPLGRSGTPEEAASVVRWLALEATYVTGEVVRVDGGRSLG